MNADNLKCFLAALIRVHGGHPLDSPWKDYEMRKGFTRQPQRDEPATPGKNYITRSGLERLKDEHRFLLTRERPAVTEVVAWAASNGDRSENADYQYGKRRLRQIDGRIRFLTKRIEAAEVVDPEAPRAGQAATRAFFGATVRYANAAGTERVVSIVGTDEVDLNRTHISWVARLGRGVSKSGARGDEGGRGRSRSSPSAGRYNIPDCGGSVLRAHFGGTVP